MHGVRTANRETRPYTALREDCSTALKRINGEKAVSLVGEKKRTCQKKYEIINTGRKKP